MGCAERRQTDRVIRNSRGERIAYTLLVRLFDDEGKQEQEQEGGGGGGV